MGLTSIKLCFDHDDGGGDGDDNQCTFPTTTHSIIFACVCICIQSY